MPLHPPLVGYFAYQGFFIMPRRHFVFQTRDNMPTEAV